MCDECVKVKQTAKKCKPLCACGCHRSNFDKVTMAAKDVDVDLFFFGKQDESGIAIFLFTELKKLMFN